MTIEDALANAKHDTRPALGPWTPGQYINSRGCVSCGDPFFCAKRCIKCADCAYAEAEAKHLETLKQVIRRAVAEAPLGELLELKKLDLLLQPECGDDMSLEEDERLGFLLQFIRGSMAEELAIETEWSCADATPGAAIPTDAEASQGDPTLWDSSVCYCTTLIKPLQSPLTPVDLPSGLQLWYKPNQAGGHTWYSNSTGAMTKIWDTAITSELELLGALMHERWLAQGEAAKQWRENK